MNTNDISVFIKVYESKSFSQAAKSLFISPQGVVKIIHRLEESLDVTLFTRSHQGVIPTDKADYLYIEMKPLIDKFDIITQNLSDTPPIRKTIRLYATCGIMTVLSLDFIDAFNEIYPDYELEVMECEDETIHRALSTDQADIGIMSSPILDNTLESVFILKIKQQIVINKDHPLAKKNSLSFNDFNGEKLSLMSRNSRTYCAFIEQLKANNVEPLAIYEAAQLETNHLRASVNNCLGLTFEGFSDYFCFENTTILPFEDDSFTWDTYFVWKADSPHAKFLQEFIDFAIEWNEEHPWGK